MSYLHLSIFWKVVWILIIGNYVGSTTSSCSWSFTASSNVWHATTFAKPIYDYYHLTCCWSNWSPHGRTFQNWSQSNSKTYSWFLCDFAWNPSRQPGNHSSGSHLKITDLFFYFIYFIYLNKLEIERNALCWSWGLLSTLDCSWSNIINYFFPIILESHLHCFTLFVQPATSDFIVRDTGNCSPRYMKCTINQVMSNVCYVIYL